jgi:hypothetical protein
MTPMEAWSIIGANLYHLYRIRRAQNPGYKGYDDADLEAEVIAFQALKEMEERQKERKKERKKET